MGNALSHRETRRDAFAALRLASVIAATLIGAPHARGQYYSTGADPIGVRWHVCQGQGWRIWSDEEALPWAAEADSALRLRVPAMQADFAGTKRHGIGYRPIDVVLHSHDAYSNGLVSWAPKRMECYTFHTGQDDCVPWVSHLTAHEYRHSLQTQTTLVGFSRFLLGLFGEQTAGVSLGLFVPKWALEGDAVWAETSHTNGGRGRRGAFMQQMRALTICGLRPSYSQAYFGSFARQVPDYYHMGFLMASATDSLRSDTASASPIIMAMDASGRLPFTLFPFARAMRKQTSMRPMRLYEWALAQWNAKWQMEAEARETEWNEDERTQDITPSEKRRDNRDYEEITAAHVWRDKLIAWVMGPDHIGHFEMFSANGDSQARQELLTPSTRLEETFAVHGDTMVWSERRQHWRWDNASENCLMAMHIPSRKTWRLTRGRTMHSPAITTKDGVMTLAAVETRSDTRHAIAVTTLDSCGLPKHWHEVIALPTGWQAAEVIWGKGLLTGKLIATIVNHDGKSIVSIDPADGQTRTLMGPIMLNASYLRAEPDGTLLFAMDPNAHDDIFALSPSGDLRRLTTSRHGMAHPCPTVNGLAVSRYGANGYSLAIVDTSHAIITSHDDAKPLTFSSQTPQIQAERKGPMRSHLLPNVHSWGPIVVDADATALRPGVSITSQNVLGTTTLQVGANTASEMRDELLFASATWDWLWPRLTFNGRWGYADYAYHSKSLVAASDILSEQDKSLGQWAKGDTLLIVTSSDCRRHMATIETSAELPITLSSGAWLRRIAPKVSFGWQTVEGANVRTITTLAHSSARPQLVGQTWEAARIIPDSRLAVGSAQISAYAMRRTPLRAAGCRLGVTAQLIYDKTFSAPDYGDRLFGSLTLYLPGIGRTHQMVLAASGQKKRKGDAYEITSADGEKTTWHYRLGDRVHAPIGLQRLANDRAALLTAQYKMPIADPDWQWGPVAYIKRIGFTGRFDQGISATWDAALRPVIVRRWTASAELWFDARFALLPYETLIGWRMTYGPTLSKTVGEVTLSISVR